MASIRPVFKWLSCLVLCQTFILKNMANNSVFNSRWSNSTSIHQFYDSALTQLRLQSFSIRLKNETRVRTPLRRNLLFRLRLGLSVFCTKTKAIFLASKDKPEAKEESKMTICRSKILVTIGNTMVSFCIDVTPLPFFL